MSLDEPLLRVFVYGTLKRGRSNHDRYCQGAVAIEPAQALGRLYNLPQGYPMLEAPPASVVALGSSDARADAGRQYEIAAQPAATIADSQDWLLVQGELITFDDPTPRLLALDSLEAYAAETQTGDYWRALIWLIAPTGMLAWTYIAPNGQLPLGATPCGNVWPSCGDA